MKTSWEKLADIDDNIEQQLELAQSASSASNPTIPLVRVIPFRRMRSSTIAGTVAESLESSLDSYRRQNNQTISNASSPVHISAEFTRSRNRVFSSILLKVDKDLFPEISTRAHQTDFYSRIEISCPLQAHLTSNRWHHHHSPPKYLPLITASRLQPIELPQ
ncbi:Nonribosomal peptide synthetase [Trichinella spiralis]|uniref:Nonribosomal peptide synthetase n=1 Tax=Trichinella spiralis TaxID=6334 RepID=A0ABR3K8Z7_TRISP